MTPRLPKSLPSLSMLLISFLFFNQRFVLCTPQPCFIFFLSSFLSIYFSPPLLSPIYALTLLFFTMWQYTLLKINSLLLFFFFLYYYSLYTFCTVCHTVCDCHLLFGVWELNGFLYSSHFHFHSIISLLHFFSSRVHLCTCVRAHTWLRIILLSNRCMMTALEEGQWFGPVSHACLSYPPVLGIPLLSFCPLFFLIYLSQTLQAVAAGWQSARAHILLK